MPITGITCLGDGLKAILLEESGHIESPSDRRKFETTVREISSCPAGMLLGLEAKGGTGKKRAPSEFNNWMKSCASKKENGGQAKPFKQCTIEWRTHPNNPKNKRH